MQKKKQTFSFEIFDSAGELEAADAALLSSAQQATQTAYAPYSRFRVAAVARLSSGKTVIGTNQENASFPAGICAERVLLSVVSSQATQDLIQAIAISYSNETGKSDRPISPCGICRQSLQEYEQRYHQPIRLILGGLHGKIYIIPKASLLLPLAFTSDELQ